MENNNTISALINMAGIMKRKQLLDLNDFTEDNLDVAIDEYMKEPTFNLGDLHVDDLILQIGEYLKPPIRHVLATTSARNHTLFAPAIKKEKNEFIQQLLQSVILGKQKSVQKFLTKYPNSLTERATVTDCSGRIFSEISAFEFAIWALDVRYMVNMMVDCLPDDATGLKIAIRLKEQYERVTQHGVTYKLNGETITETHFDLSKLINVLQTFRGNFARWTEEQQEEYWCTTVGLEQFYLPAHMMQHYYDTPTFVPPPSFTAETLMRTDIAATYAVPQYEYDASLFEEKMGLGIDGALFRLGEPSSIMCAIGTGLGDSDVGALQKLHDVRTEDCKSIKQLLENLCETLGSRHTSACKNA